MFIRILSFLVLQTVRSTDLGLTVTGNNNNEVISDDDYELSNTYLTVGNAYFKNRSLTAALTCYKKAVDLNYFHVPALVNLGVVYVEQENLLKGEQYFHRASELSGEFLYHVQNGLGTIYLQRGNAAKAFTHFMKGMIIAKNNLDPAVGVFEYQQSISNIGLVLRSASSLDVNKIRTQLKTYQVPIDYRFYFKEGFKVVINDINIYRKVHNLQCILRIIEPGAWEGATFTKQGGNEKGKVQLLKSYNSFDLNHGLYYGVKPKTVGDGLSQKLLTEPMNDFAPYSTMPGKTFLYKDRVTKLYAISNIYVDGRIVGTMHDSCNLFLRSNDFLPPASLFGKLTFEMPGLDDSNYIQKRFKFAVNIVSRWTDNYYHFLVEAIPRLVIMLQDQSLILRSIFKLEKNNNSSNKENYTQKQTITIPIIVQDGPSYIHELIDTLIKNHFNDMVKNVNKHNDKISLDYSIQYLNDKSIYFVEKLFTVEIHGDNQNMFNLETAGSRYALQETQKYFNAISETLPLMSRNEHNHDNFVIFVSRSMFQCDEKYGTEHLKGVKKSRLLINHDDVIKEIKMHIDIVNNMKKKQYVFKIENGCHTMKDTIDTWAQAHTIIGVHGAGLSNMLFTKRSINNENVVTLIEITPLEPAFRDYFHLASSLNIVLWAMVLGEEGMMNSYLAHKIKVELGKLRNILNAVIK